jgi:cytochrome oxidase Cu insertion factor (SCO1/SenC/PrrC family)
MQLRSAALLFVLLAAFITAAQAQEKRIVLEHPLVLADADGKTVTSDDFPEKFLLVYFGYTHCADQCPTALSAMVEALAEIGPAADYIQPLFVTVDPERDRGAAGFHGRVRQASDRVERITSADRRRGRDARHRVPEGARGQRGLHH